jgi:hypothetical protein
VLLYYLLRTTRAVQREVRELEEFARTASVTAGTVVGLVEKKPSGKRRPLYAPVVRFRPSGEAVEREFTSRSGSRPASHRMGDTVQVLYDPANPSHACLQNWDDSNARLAVAVYTLVSVVAGFLMVVALANAVAVIVRIMRQILT